jgi:hypothetical protein
MTATANNSTLLQLGFLYSSTLAVPQWTYFRHYLSSPPGQLCIRMQQQPPQPFGLRLVYAQDAPVNPSWQLSQISGGESGSFELRVQPTVTDFATLYIGVQALLVFQGTSTYTFRLGVFSCNPSDDIPLPPRPAISPLLPSGLFYTPLTLAASPLAAHVAAGVAALFRFKAAAHQSSGTFRITVIEDNPDISNLLRNSLRVVVRIGAPPSLATFDAASPDIRGTFKPPTHTLTLRFARDDVWIGVFGISQKPQLHEFHIQAVLQPAAALVPAIVPLQNNFKSAFLRISLAISHFVPRCNVILAFLNLCRYFNTQCSAGQYIYFSVAVPNLGSDLLIAVKAPAGVTDIYLSTSSMFPNRSVVGSYSWASESYLGGGLQLIANRFDDGFVPGVFYTSVYCITSTFFSIAAALDPAPTKLEIGFRYRFTALTYSFANYYVLLDVPAPSMRIVVMQAGDVAYASMLVSFGAKPSLSGSAEHTRSGNLTLQVDYVMPKLGVYQLSVSFFPDFYFGAALRHLYDIYVEVGAMSAQTLDVDRARDTRTLATSARPPLYSAGQRVIVPFAPVNVVLFSSDVQSFRFFAASYMVALNITVAMATRTPLSAPSPINATKSPLIILIRRQAPPTRKTFLSRSVCLKFPCYASLSSPIQGTFYHIAVATLAPVPPMRGAVPSVDLSIAYTAGAPVLPSLVQLRSFVTRSEQAQAGTYKYYFIDIAGLDRDFSLGINTVRGRISVFISKTNKYPDATHDYAPGWSYVTNLYNFASTPLNFKLVFRTFDPQFSSGRCV